MSNIKYTVEEILQMVSDMKAENSTNTDAERIRFVSNANKDFAKRNFWRTHRLSNQTQVGDATNDYTIDSVTYPMREKGLTEVFVTTTGSTNMTPEASRRALVDFNVYKNAFNQNNSAKMCYEWYDLETDVWKMHINPAPAATETITYSYFFEPPTLTATTDSVICPNPKIIMYLVLADISHSEEEYEEEQLWRAEAEQLVLERSALENTPAVNQQYSMGAAENSGSIRGYGTY